MKAWRAQGADAWERLTPGAWDLPGSAESGREKLTRPAAIPVDTARAKVGPALGSRDALKEALRKTLGAEEKIFSFQSGGFRYDVLANAETLAEHIPLDRAPFTPLIREALEDPYEVWLSFERHKGTGKYALRQRIIKAVKLGKNRAVLMVAQSKSGIMEAWTMIPTSNLDYVNNQRRGKLIWAR
jgi:hypothetical protein